jgi:hypothetical protein
MKKSPLMDNQEIIEYLRNIRRLKNLDHQILSEVSMVYQKMIEPFLMEDSIYLSLEIALLGGKISQSETVRFYSSCFWKLNKGVTFITTAKEPIKLLKRAS